MFICICRSGLLLYTYKLINIFNMHYEEKDFGLPEMEALSEKQMSEHLKLYSGYIKNINGLMDDLKMLEADPEKNLRAISELSRRLPFEWNGMRMHELYFEGLGGNGKPEGAITKLIQSQYGTFDNWLSEFKRVGASRGTGWTLLVLDRKGGFVFNIWVNDHELGHLGGADILIAMDLWEHAYLIDYLPGERKDYIDAFIKNIKWNTVNQRLSDAQK
jgi:superoxide dismutase, Fe-Mn family